VSQCLRGRFCSSDPGDVVRFRRSRRFKKAARRKIAAPQPVIVSERRSRESNDLSRRSPLCGPLLASFSHDPTPHNTFVENKDQTSIRPSGRPSGRSLFLCFLAVQSGPISALFFRFCCPVGRGSQRGRGWVFWRIASCQLLAACFQRSSKLLLFLTGRK